MEVITCIKLSHEEQRNILFAIGFTLEHMEVMDKKLEERCIALEKLYGQMSKVLNYPEWEKDEMSSVKKNLPNVSSKSFLLCLAV